MKTSELINEFAKAMAEAQKQMRPAAKDGLNPHFKSRYSNISSIWEAIRSPMTSNGLTVLQDVITEEKSVSVVTRIIHHSGQWVEFGPLGIPLMKFDAQSIGSATSYAKRYALCAAIGVVSDEEDDDGEKAQSRDAKIKEYPKPDPAKVKELLDILEKCPKEYVLSIQKGINSRGWKTFGQMDISSFESLMKDAMKKSQVVEEVTE